MTVLALDLSSTATGVCYDDGTTRTIAPKGKSFHVRARAMRDALASEAADLVPDVIVCEAIGTHHIQTAIAIGTVHALVLDMLTEYTPTSRLILVTPTQLKKWATGKGAGPGTDKAGMMLAAQRAGWVPPADLATVTDDQADAWWLWTIGRHIEGADVVSFTVYRADVVNGLADAVWLDRVA